MANRRGRKQKWVVHPKTGETIIGLKHRVITDKKTGENYSYYFYIIPQTNPERRKSLGSDFDEAYSRFLDEYKPKKETVQVPRGSISKTKRTENYDGGDRGIYELDKNLTGDEESAEILIDKKTGKITVIKNSNAIDKQQLAKLAREWILSDIVSFRQATGLPIECNYNVTSKSFDCADLWQIFVEKRKEPLSAGRVKNVKRYWEFFAKTQKHTISDKTSANDILYFYQRVYKNYKTSTTRADAISDVRAVLNHARKKVDKNDKQILQNVINLIDDQGKPERQSADVRIVEAEPFQKILDASSPKYRLIWLMMLNFGIRDADIRNIDIDDFDMSGDTYIFRKRRTKTGIIQTAYLMQPTKEALIEYLKIRDREKIKANHLFFNKNNKLPMSDAAKTIAKMFTAATKKAGIKGISIKNLRQSTDTVASYYHCADYAVKIVMGHSFGGKVAAAYKYRDVKMTKKVTDAICDYYFNNHKNMPDIA